MKKRKLSKKAQSYLKNYQAGGFEPLSTIPNVLQRNYQQSLIEKQKKDQLLLNNLQATATAAITPTDTTQTTEVGVDILGKLNPMLKVGYGIVQLIQAQKQKKDAKKRQKMYDEDLQQRMNESRVNDYYQTPYTSYQLGGQTDLDAFSQFYAQQEDLNSQYSQEIENYYDQLSQIFTNRYKNTKKQGLMDISQGVQQTIDSLEKVLTAGISPTGGGKMSSGGRYDSIIDKYRSRMRNVKQGRYRKQDGGLSGTLGAMMAPFEGIFSSLKEDKSLLYNQEEINRLNSEINNFEELRRTNKQVSSIFYKDPTIGKKFSTIDNERLKQDGGDITQPQSQPQPIEGETDIYSENFNVDKFNQQGNEDQKVGEVLNLEIGKTSQEVDEESALLDWVLQDEEPNYSPVEEDYFNGQPSTTSDQGSVIDKIGNQESGGDYGRVNTTGGTNATGKYQFLPKWWSGQIKSFMNLPREMSKEQVMESFRTNPQAQDAFMNHVMEDIYKPIVEDVRPLARKYGLSDEQVYRFLHFRGEGDVRRMLRTGDFSISQEEKDKYKNPDVLTYLNK